MQKTPLPKSKKSGQNLEQTDLGPDPVIVRKGEDGENSNPPMATELDELPQRPRAGVVASRGRQPPLAGPPRIAVHDHRHVLRHQIILELRRERLSLRRHSGEGAPISSFLLLLLNMFPESYSCYGGWIEGLEGFRRREWREGVCLGSAGSARAQVFGFERNESVLGRNRKRQG